MDLRATFDDWGRFTGGQFADRQWLLAKWEVCEGVVWPEAKIALMARLLRERLAIRPGDVFADLGCGGGWILKRLAPEAGFSVGLDFSAVMIANAAGIHAGNALVQGDITRLPFRDASLDRALCYFVLINMMEDGQVEAALREIRRVLRPGGRALVGQMPDAAGSQGYDQAKAAHLERCRAAAMPGRDLREVHRMPQKLFDVARLRAFLSGEGIDHEFLPAFNPFWDEAEPPVVPWRFDLLLKA